MPDKLPRSLVVTLALISAVSFGISEYLEWFHLAWLERHPITTNLLSGVVGFSSATLVVAVGFRWYAGRAAAVVTYKREQELWQETLYQVRRKIHAGDDLSSPDQIRMHTLQAERLLKAAKAAGEALDRHTLIFQIEQAKKDASNPTQAVTGK